LITRRRARISQADAILIREFKKAGYTLQQIADVFHSSKTTINHYVQGRYKKKWVSKSQP
jgi:predicted transcriptional regulator